MAERIDNNRQPRASRSRLSLSVLIAMAAIGVGLCLLVVSPFVPGLVWALSLSVVAWPLHRLMARWIRWPSVAAALSTVVVTLLLLLPALFLAWHVGSQVSERIEQAEQFVESGQFQELINRYPRAARMYSAVNGDSGSAPAGTEVVQPVGRMAGAWLSAAAAASVQIAVALFTLFFLFRDRQAVLDVIRSLMPMSRAEVDYLFEQIRSMTHATIYGTFVVAAIQGGLGGLMFGLLGIPGAILWGFVMALLSIIPSAGAFVIWLPATVVLAVQGEMVKATILGVWGAVAVSMIDNLIYPLLVGQEVRLHTLPVFLAVVGGLVVFGAAGIVLGPVILAATIALLNILAGRVRARPPLPT